ncbi:interleukin-12 receptor subunit beta-1 isoform X2 [Apodemus sylvaticus]|uniref:interleukin-12 receptor subunit beta-1 isoform X2 n=1 Tax=Apodemus sylvaticus TaxID=10129 RepID=UPI002244D1DB|nr:interleukin-12 receptor subunit beta-1 isoform X2 [Apodemus sylvaticus]
MGTMRLPGPSRHVAFLLLCQLGASSRGDGCCVEKTSHPDEASGSSLGPRNLSCYRVSGTDYECSWQYDGPEDNVAHFLWCCFVRQNSTHAGFGQECCCCFSSGRSRTVQFWEQDGISMLSKVTFWVESRLGNRTLKSQEISQYLYNWTKLTPPLGHIRVSRSHGQLRMDWNVSDEVGAEVQFRRRMPTTNWTSGDCGPQVTSGLSDIRGSSSESCLCPSENMTQEIQIRRRRRLSSGAPGGPWSDWSVPVCVPPEVLPQAQIKFLVEPLNQGGRRRLTMQGQSPQLAVPEGCRGRPGAQVKRHLVLVRMLSCRCQAQTSKTVPLGKTLNLSGAAYDLAVLAKTRFGHSTIQRWPLPAQELSGTRTLNVSLEGNVTFMQWAAQAPGTTYCLEWQPWEQHRNHTHCTLIAPEEEDPAKMVTHSWSSVPALDQEGCYRVTVFASKNPKNPTLWATVLSSYYFGGNASRVGTPRHVSVRNHTGDSVSVEWTASQLSTCPWVLTQYVVRCEAEDGTWESEWLVPPTKTQVTLDGLRSRVVYKVQVRADTERLRGAWSPAQRFSFEVQVSRLSIIFASLGSFASVLLVGSLGYIGLHRAAWHLCPPLPTPCGSTAVELPGSQGKQAWQWRNPEDFPEVLYPRDELVVEVPGDGGDGTESPQAGPERAMDTRRPSETEGRGQRLSEARRLGLAREDSPRSDLAHVTLPLLLGDVTQGASAPDDLWTDETVEPGPTTMGQEA